MEKEREEAKRGGLDGRRKGQGETGKCGHVRWKDKEGKSGPVKGRWALYRTQRNRRGEALKLNQQLLTSG